MKRKKTGGKDWQPGQSGNPAGRMKLPQDVKDARKFNAAEATRIITKFLYMTADEIAQCLKDPSTPALDLMLGKIVIEATNKGDQFRLDFLLNRTIGKVQEKLKVTGPKPTIIKLIDQDAAIVLGHAPTDEEDEE